MEGSRAALYEERKFPEADDLLHREVPARRELRREETCRQAEALDRELHPLAQAKREARKVVPAWLERSKAFLADPADAEPGRRLFDEGERLAERWVDGIVMRAEDSRTAGDAKGALRLLEDARGKVAGTPVLRTIEERIAPLPGQ